MILSDTSSLNRSLLHHQAVCCGIIRYTICVSVCVVCVCERICVCRVRVDVLIYSTYAT